MTKTLETMIAETVAKRTEKEREARETEERKLIEREQRALLGFEKTLTKELGDTLFEITRGQWFINGDNKRPYYSFDYNNHVISLQYEREHLGASLLIIAEDERDQHAKPKSAIVHNNPQDIMLEHVLLEIHELTQDEPAF